MRQEPPDVVAMLGQLDLLFSQVSCVAPLGDTLWAGDDATRDADAGRKAAEASAPRRFDRCGSRRGNCEPPSAGRCSRRSNRLVAATSPRRPLSRDRTVRLARSRHARRGRTCDGVHRRDRCGGRGYVLPRMGASDGQDRWRTQRVAADTPTVQSQGRPGRRISRRRPGSGGSQATSRQLNARRRRAHHFQMSTASLETAAMTRFIKLLGTEVRPVVRARRAAWNVRLSAAQALKQTDRKRPEHITRDCRCAHNQTFGFAPIPVIHRAVTAYRKRTLSTWMDRSHKGGLRNRDR